MSGPRPPGSPEAAPPPPTPRWANGILMAICWIAIAFLLLQILTFGYGRDQGIYAMVARALLSGQMPYRDAWDFKPPGVFLVYAVARAIFGDAQVGIRVLECAGLVAMVAAMRRLAQRWWGEPRIGVLAGALAVLVHAELDFWHTAQPESFGGMVTMFALVALGPALGPRTGEAVSTHPWRELVAGALFGFAGLLKPPLAGGGAVVAVFIAVRAYRSGDRRGALQSFLAVAIGGALPIALCLAWFWARGALPDLVAVLFVFTPHYTALGWEGERVVSMLYIGFEEWFVEYSSLLTAGLLLLLALRPSRRERLGVAVVAAIIAVHIAGVTAQAKFFPYHWGATWPLTAMLAGLGFWHAWESLARRGPVFVLAFFVALAVILFGRTASRDLPDSFFDRCRKRIALFTHTPRDAEAIDRLASVADVNAVANRAVAKLLRDEVATGRTVFIWGFEPVIYDLASRSPATRYLYDVPQRVAWAKQEAREVLMRDLAEKNPAAIVVEHRDVFPVVTGDAIDSADTLANFPALRDMLATRYRLKQTIEDFDVYLSVD